MFAFNVVDAQTKDSLTIKIGQMILVGFAGTSVDEAVLTEVKEGKVGSIILVRKKYSTAELVRCAQKNNLDLSAGCAYSFNC